jgi:hypothetical protein
MQVVDVADIGVAAVHVFTGKLVDSELGSGARANLLSKGRCYVLEGRRQPMGPAVLLDFGNPASTSAKRVCALAPEAAPAVVGTTQQIVGLAVAGHATRGLCLSRAAAPGARYR